jgi:GTP-binding protein
LDSCPPGSLPEFAFIGRSNVGKSSLLNMLSGKQGLARVSPTPGHTKLINMFTMNKTWRLVDLPGYGFAKVARKDKSKFNQAVANYLQLRPNLCCVFTLIDSVLPPQKIDLEFIEWLVDNTVPFVLVFTKIDLVKPSKVEATIKAFTDHISEWCEGLPQIYCCSATTGAGRGALLGMISEAIASEPAETRKASESPPQISADAWERPRKRPDLNRPW